jgi:hypothetical protein
MVVLAADDGRFVWRVACLWRSIEHFIAAVDGHLVWRVANFVQALPHIGVPHTTAAM